MDEGVRERDAGCSLNKLLRQLVALPVWHREWREDRDREQHSEMLARLKEFNEDVDKLFAECKQDTESDPDECNQELKDCVPEPRQILRRMSRQESLRMCLRVQVCFRESLRGLFRVWIRLRLHAEREYCVMGNHDQTQTQHQRSIDNRNCKRMHVQIAHNSVALNEVFGGTQLTREKLRSVAHS